MKIRGAMDKHRARSTVLEVPLMKLNIGFFIENRETVDKLNRRLKEDGFDVPAPEDTGHSYGFYVKAPGEFTVEVGA